MTDAAGAKWRKRILIGSGLLLLAVSLFLIFHRPILTAAAEGLIVEDELIESDLIFLLNGDAARGARAYRAAKLFHAGISERVAVAATSEVGTSERATGAGQSSMNVALLRSHDVPDSAITILPYAGGVATTRDEGRALRAFVQDRGYDRVTVVTSEVHTGRAKLIIRQELHALTAEIRMASSPDPYNASNWWTFRTGRRAYVAGYVKLGIAMLLSRSAPW